MLHAISQKKSQLHKRYLGYREPDEVRVGEEDELTSLLIGPLAFLPAQAIATFWERLIKHAHPSIDWPTGTVTQAQMHFWPRRPIAPQRYIEPDLLVQIHWPTGERRTLLVEFKWRAPLSSERQLHDQWQKFLTLEEQAHALHLFIAPEVSHGLAALDQDDIWQGRLLLRSWLDVLACLQRLPQTEDEPLGHWAAQVTKVLAMLNIHPFQGFVNLDAPTLEVTTQPIFWQPQD
ncbi:hypothetical protein SAMN04487857_111192 [Pseudomonas sp. ok272]|uniref:hypothetical protein n=1 Tax=unclassified Pseudomonas TaxID=196821 RepID=UPI0008AABB05|nr:MULTISPECIES: hypothetical protein [unclassified Pseudomonas]SEN20744.1 hypothetical protein SAMN04487857_111192 [Pseudomonas sp. ok272]SFN12651.1 hypothetical protein SAMN04487858_112192 [Pseudomonas sp. ok602]